MMTTTTVLTLLLLALCSLSPGLAVISSSTSSALGASRFDVSLSHGLAKFHKRKQRREGNEVQQALVSVQAKRDNRSTAAAAAMATTQKNAVLEWLPDGLKNGLASGLAAAVVKAILQPFDTIKTVQQAKQALKIGPFAAGAQIIKERGIGGLWSGIGVTVIGSSPSVAVYFGVYSSCKSRFSPLFPQSLQLVAVALSAMVGNTLASVLRVPYEVIKQRIQAGQFSSTIDAVRHSWKTEGIVGLFGGGKLSSQILRDVPYAIVTLVSYEIFQGFLTKLAQKRLQDSVNDGKGKGNTKAESATAASFSTLTSFLGNKKLKDAFCGSIAGGLGTLATTPMDVIKTRMMTGTRYTSIFDAFAKIASEEGFMTFFVGTVRNLLISQSFAFA